MASQSLTQPPSFPIERMHVLETSRWLKIAVICGAVFCTTTPTHSIQAYNPTSPDPITKP